MLSTHDAQVDHSPYRLCSAKLLAQLFYSLDRRLHQLFQDLPVHIVQGLDIKTARAGGELAKSF